MFQLLHLLQLLDECCSCPLAQTFAFVQQIFEYCLALDCLVAIVLQGKDHGLIWWVQRSFVDGKERFNSICQGYAYRKTGDLQRAQMSAQDLRHRCKTLQ